jgi:hypothetical protein
MKRFAEQSAFEMCLEGVMEGPTSNDEAPMLPQRSDHSSGHVVSTDRLLRLFRYVERNSGRAEPLAVGATQDPSEDLVPPDETVC